MSFIRTRKGWPLLAIVSATLVALFPTIITTGNLIGLGYWRAWFVFSIALAYAALAYVGVKLYERTRQTFEAAVRADKHGLYLDGRLVLTRRAIRHGNLMVEGERLFLRLHRRAPFAAPYDIEVADEAEARRLLADLRLDAQTSVSEFELRIGTRRRAKLRGALRVAAVVASMIGAVSVMQPFGERAAFVCMILASLLGSYFMSSNVVEVAVGADGLHVKRVIGRARFIAYADLRDVRLEGQDVHLELADGTSLALHRDEEGQALEQRIREALSLHRARNVNAAAAVNRGGRTTAAWLRDTKERGATYRRAVVPDDELWSIVEDAAASPTERAGAALALRAELDEKGQDRLRIAAGACAEKKLRVALESVAERADDEALEEVLEPLEDRRSQRVRAATS